MKFLKTLVCFFSLLLLLVCSTASAQDLLKANPSQINVDQLSDADIIKYQQQLKAAGITESQAEQIALSRGMPQSEILKLKQRIALLNTRKSSSLIEKDTTGRQRRQYNDSTDTITKKPMINPRIFGAELFNNAALNFEPDLQIAAPINYMVGPGDEISVTVYGVQETSEDLRVSPEGSINIPNVGQVKITGMTLEAGTQKIRDIMERTAYPTLRTGASKLSVTIGKIKSIRVTIIGANKPGNYTLSSLATAFNALFAAGGPRENGSFRQIELVRPNGEIRKIDLYKFLVSGDQSENYGLQNNDVIRIPAYKTRVELDGYVKRPGIFEMLPGETFSDLLHFASGFGDSAYKASVSVTQFSDKELRVKDISAAEFDSYQPQPGDKFFVGKIINRFENRVIISGAVERPGFFELKPNMTLKDLIQNADGLREDAFTQRGLVFRKKADLTRELIPFNVQSVLNNGETLQLVREDSVVIKSITDLQEEYYVSIQGEVRNPGYYNYAENMAVKDVILQAGGLTDAAYPQRIEVARLISRDTLTKQDVRASNIIDINNISDLSLQANNVELKPFDVITIRRKPGYLELQSVTVAGELQYPGPYVISKREERVSDLIKRAGGFTPEAYREGAYIKRYNDDIERNALKKENIERIQNEFGDSTTAVSTDILREFDQIPLNVDKILLQPGSPEDVVLQPRDELIVPKYSAQVRISGSVLFPTQIPFNENYSLKNYLSAAGGVSENGKKSKIYVLYANGKAKSTSSFLFFKNYPEVKPGTEIIVPRKSDRKNRLSTGEVIGISSALASLAGVVIAILQLTK